MEFFREGNVRLGADISTPYQITVADLTEGPHTLTAVATDGQGLTTTSAAVRIDVVPLLAIERLEPGQLRLKVVAQPDVAYVLERSAEPSGVGALRWNTVSNFVFVLPEKQITEPVPAGNISALYRVRRQ